VIEGRHILTFTVPPSERVVVVRWDDTVCKLRFPLDGGASPSNPGMNASAAAPLLKLDAEPSNENQPAEPKPGTAAREARKPGPEPATRRKPTTAKRPSPVSAGSNVLVPASLWPDQRCDEHGGQGWEAKVRVVRGATAVVEFVYAKDESGLPYEAVTLKAECLVPLEAEPAGKPPSQARRASEGAGSGRPHSITTRPNCEGTAP
jgi:hypothetical protein